MPIYEFRCDDCGKKISVLILKAEEQDRLRCPHCKSANLKKVFSRFASLRSEEDRLESLADPSKWGDLDENDPKSMMKFIKKMGKEFGEELGEDYDQLMEEAEEEIMREAEGKSRGGDDLYTPGELSE